MSVPLRLATIVAACTFLGFGIWGATQLEVRFETVWFLPPDSYLTAWFDAKEELFPAEGAKVTIYLTDLDYPREMGKIDGLVKNLEASNDIISSVDSWYPSLETFFNDVIEVGGENGMEAIH